LSLKTRFLDPDLVRRLGRAEVKARQTVEGFLTGLHTSPYRGFSVEFAEHRSYVPGDDPRHIDWKVYGRRERYYVKQYHEETNFVANILLDASESMTFASKRMSKLEYGCILAAAISLVVLRQNDAAALGLFDHQAAGYLPAGTRLSFLARLTGLLERIQPTGQTDIAASLEQYTRLISRRGIIVVISDFLDHPDTIVRGLQKLKFTGHEVVALNILDPYEQDFPLKGHIRFEALERDARVRVEPQRIRDAYLEALEKHLHAIRIGCSRSGIDYRLASTAEPVEELLLSYLATRHKVRRVAR
jgi:uncharacterized protein (DUF58 family)